MIEEGKSQLKPLMKFTNLNEETADTRETKQNEERNTKSSDQLDWSPQIKQEEFLSPVPVPATGVGDQWYGTKSEINAWHVFTREKKLQRCLRCPPTATG